MPREDQETVARRRALALAYAEKFGTDMIPPSARRPIVTAEEIAASVAEIGEDATPEPVRTLGRLLDSRAATLYLGVGRTTFRKWINLHGLPVAAGIRAKGQQSFYRVEDLEDLRVRAEQAQADALKPAKDPAPAPERAKPPAPKPQPTVRKTKMPRVTDQTMEAHARLDKLVRLVREGTHVDEAAVEAGYSRSSTARATAVRLNRTDALAVLPDGRIAENSGIAARKRAKTKLRLDEFAGLMRQGVPAEDAARQMGWTGIHAAKATARNHRRTDVLALIRDRRKPQSASESLERAA